VFFFSEELAFSLLLNSKLRLSQIFSSIEFCTASSYFRGVHSHEERHNKRSNPCVPRLVHILRWVMVGDVRCTMTLGMSQSIPSDSDLDSDSDDSLFDEPPILSTPVAMRRVPPIPGLFLPPVLIPVELAAHITRECMRLYFDGRDINQIMLFGRTATDQDREEEDLDARMGKGLPSVLIELLHRLSALLQPSIPGDLHDHLFPSKGAPPRARQAILNLYRPGEGITPHVDLLKRFDDGIIGVSLCGNCVMTFEEAGNSARGSQKSIGKEDGNKWNLFLPEGSVLVMSKEARYNWKHGIPGRTHDLVENANESHDPYLIKRGVRLSVTFRWLLPGADIVGGPEA